MLAVPTARDGIVLLSRGAWAASAAASNAALKPEGTSAAMSLVAWSPNGLYLVSALHCTANAKPTFFYFMGFASALTHRFLCGDVLWCDQRLRVQRTAKCICGMC